MGSVNIDSSVEACVNWTSSDKWLIHNSIEMEMHRISAHSESLTHVSEFNIVEMGLCNLRINHIMSKIWNSGLIKYLITKIPVNEQMTYWKEIYWPGCPFPPDEPWFDLRTGQIQALLQSVLGNRSEWQIHLEVGNGIKHDF